MNSKKIKAVVNSCLVSIGFWLFVFNPSSPIYYSTIAAHGITAIIILVEFIFSTVNVSWWDFFTIMGFNTAYTTFGSIYFQVTGKWVYESQNPLTTKNYILNYFLNYILMIVLYVVLKLFSFARNKLVTFIYKKIFIREKVLKNSNELMDDGIVKNLEEGSTLVKWCKKQHLIVQCLIFFTSMFHISLLIVLLVFTLQKDFNLMSKEGMVTLIFTCLYYLLIFILTFILVSLGFRGNFSNEIQTTKVCLIFVRFHWIQFSTVILLVSCVCCILED
jgi:hypothetical protein